MAKTIFERSAVGGGAKKDLTADDVSVAISIGVLLIVCTILTGVELHDHHSVSK